MASVQEIRQRLRGQRIETLRSRIEPLLAERPGAEVWPLAGAPARWRSLVTAPLRQLPLKPLQRKTTASR
jgi:hypothetical protein